MSTRTKPKKRTPSALPVQREVKKAAGRKTDPYAVLTFITVMVFMILRIKLLDVPLERDEGEYAYMGQLLLDGIAPYKQGYNMKLPGTYFMYALLMAVLGESTAGIHLGLMLVNAATMLLIYFGFRKIFHPTVAFFSAAIYGFMSLSPAFLGFAAHATHFVSLFLAAGMLFYGRYIQQSSARDAILFGLMMGLSFLMKQQAVFFMVMGGLLVILSAVITRPRKYGTMLKHLAGYSAGAVLPYLLTVLFLYMAGAFDKFWFWTVEYAGKYATGLNFKEGRAMFMDTFTPMWKEFGVYWVLFAAGLVAVFFSSLSLQRKLIALTFTLFTILSVLPGFYFRQHYFIPFLPAVGLMGGIAIYYFAQQVQHLTSWNFTGWLSPALFFVTFLVIMPQKPEYYLHPEPETVSRSIYGGNPFIESPVIAGYIREHTQENDRLAVMGSEPQIFFYAGRRSASGHIYTYGMMEDHNYNLQMQKEMIAEIEAARPKFMVICNIGTSWLKRVTSPTLIFDWSSSYIQKHYIMEGVVDIISEVETVYKWGPDAQQYAPRTENVIYIFKRK